MPSSETMTPAQRRRVLWGSNLRAVLDEQQLSPRELHRSLIEAGADVSTQAIYLWLSGDSAPTPENQAVIAKVLGKPAHELFPVGE